MSATFLCPIIANPLRLITAALNALRRFGRSPAAAAEEDPVSMVLLLRNQQFFSVDQLRAAGERAFSLSLAKGKESQHFVVETAMFTIMKAGPHTVSLLNYTKPYGDRDFPHDFAKSWPKLAQREAWAEHKAWTAVDYVKGGVDPELEYAVLARLCSEMLDANCVGLYLPRERSFIPNDASLRGELQRISASRDLRLM